MRLLVSPLLCFALSGCPDRAPSPVPRLDLSRPSISPAPRAVLVPVALDTQADFDRLEDDYLERRSPQSLVTALTMLAEVPLSTPAGAPLADRDALLLQRLSMLHLALADDASQRNQDPAFHSQKALELARELTDRAPDSPHTHFLQGYIPFTQIGGSDRRDAFVDPADMSRKPLRDAVVARWRLLLLQAPTYHGPRGYAPARISAAADQVEAASTKAEVAAPTSSPSRPATQAEVGAITELARLERSPDGVRTTTCRDWMRARQENEPLALARLSLFCATHQGNVEATLALITYLDAEDPGAFDACLALARLTDRVPVTQLGALAQHPLVDRCSR